MYKGKRILMVFVVLFVCIAVFATESESNVKKTERKNNWNIYGGTSYLVSHIGASYNVNQWEFGGTLYSGFPNIGIIGYLSSEGEEKPNLMELLGSSFKLIYAGNVSALYNLTKSDQLDFSVGLSLSGFYPNLKEILGESFQLGIVSLDIATKIQFNFENHSGIYISSELPIAGVIFSNQTEEDSKPIFFTVSNSDYLGAVITLVAYTTRIGYVYRF